MKDIKVLSFVEAYYKTCEEMLEYNKLIGLELERSPFEDYHRRVAQLFKPEMIVGLFVGWAEKVQNVYQRWSEENQNWDEEVIITPDYFNYKITGYATLAKPRTLDDFICDCQRAGIELIWTGKP